MVEQFKPSFEPSKDSQHPLVRFRGVLNKYEAQEQTFEGSDRKSVRVAFAFTDLEVLEANEPYNFPITIVNIPYSESSKTRWEALKNSASKVLPQRDIDLLIGKKQEWYWTDCTLRTRDDAGKWGDAPGKAWQIVSVEGSGPSDSGQTLNQALVDMVDGKSDSAFYQMVFTDPKVKAMPGFTNAVEAITNRTLLESFITAGLVTRDSDGIYHKV